MESHRETQNQWVFQTLQVLAGAIKARWICEQAHQQLKEELGLDHFEGRSWSGLHRHALMSMMAYAFLQSRRLAQAGQKKEPSGRHCNPVCQQCVRPSLTTSLVHPGHNALIADRHSKDILTLFCQSSARQSGYHETIRRNPRIRQ